MQIDADSLTLTLAILNTKPVGCDTLSRTTTVPSFKSFWSAVFVLSVLTYTGTHCTPSHILPPPLTPTHTHIMTKWSQCRRRRTT